MAQAKLILPDAKPNSLKATRHLSNSMKELCTPAEDDLKAGSGDKAAGGKTRRNSIRQWVAGATHRKKYSAAAKQLKESLSRESSLERSDVLPTGGQSGRSPAKITTSSSLLPQFSLKDDAAVPAAERPKERKRRMSTFTDWKPSFGGSSGPFGLTAKPDVLESDRRKSEGKAELKASSKADSKSESGKAGSKTESKPESKQESKITKDQASKRQLSEIVEIDRPVHLNKLDEEAEEEDENITELSSPQLSKRSSAVAIHEMKSSPGTSLSGVFYCSSSVQSISNRKSSLSIQTQGSSRMSIASTGEAAGASQAESNKLQRRSTLNVSSYSRHRHRKTNRADEDADDELKRRSVSGDLTLDTAFHATFLHQPSPVRTVDQTPTDVQLDQCLSPSTLPTTSNYATSQPSPIVTQTIVEDEINQRSIVPVAHTAVSHTSSASTAHTAIDFNQTEPPTASNLTTGRPNTVTSSRHSSYASSSSKHRSSKSGRSRHSSSAETAPGQSTIKTPDESVRPRKFCKYFRWYDWMTKRDDRSLFIFPPENRIRLKCIKLTEHKTFDYVVLIFISLNCITLAMERPKIPPWSTEREVLNAANYIFTFVFAVEMALKVIAKGLFYGDEAYFTSGWNCMDGLLVGVSLFDLTLSMIAQRSPRILGILRVFRLLRSLRPLR